MRKCKDCVKTKPVNEFYKNNLTGYYSSYCKDCQGKRRAKDAENAREKKREIRKSEFNICLSCGLDDWVVMEFHHHDDNKEGSCADIKGLTNWRNEVAKCTVLCANCHRRLHNSRNEDFFG